MSNLVTILLCAFLSFAANAAPLQSINLPPLDSKTPLRDKPTGDFTGRCGDSIVRVLGVEYIGDKHFMLEIDAGLIAVRHHGDELTLNVMDSFLSDYVGVSCVRSEETEKLLIWTQCNGISTHCTEDYSYYVIDPASHEIVPSSASDSDCDWFCANNILKGNAPNYLHPGLKK